MKLSYSAFFVSVFTLTLYLSGGFAQDVAPIDISTMPNGPLHNVEHDIKRGKGIVEQFKALPNQNADVKKAIANTEAVIKQLENQRDQMARARGEWKEFDKRLAYPCDLKKFKALPKIVLQGDNHNDPKCKTAVCQLVEKGTGGQCHVGLENVLVCKFTALDDDDLRARFKIPKEKLTKDSRTSGLDDALTHGYGNLIRADLIAHSLSAQKTQAASDTRAQFAAELVGNKLLVQTLLTVEKGKEKLGKDEQAILDFFVKNQKANVGDVIKSIRALDEDHPMRQNPKAYENVLHAWLRAYVDYAMSDDVKDKGLTPSNLREITEAHIARTDLQLPMQIAVIEWRNRFMAKNIGELYCEAAKEGKDLHIVAGNFHVRGLHGLLTQMGGDSGPTIDVVRPR